MERNPLAAQILKELGKYYKGPQDFLEAWLACVVSRTSVFLLSSHGKAKTWLAEVTARVLGAKMGRVQGDPGTTRSSFLGRLNLPKLLKGQLEVLWKKDFLDAEIKFLDEINRNAPPALSSLFPVLAEGRAVYDDHEYRLPKAFVVATANPADQGTFELPPPFLDRFGASFIMPTPTWMEKVRVVKMREKNPNPRKVADLKAIWAEVEKITLPEAFIELVTGAVASVQRCEKGEREVLRDFPQCCQNCDRQGQPCALAAMVPSERAYLSAISMAKGYKWIFPDAEPELLLNYVLPHVLRHRVAYSPKALEGKATTEDALADLVSEAIRVAVDAYRAKEEVFAPLRRVYRGEGGVEDLKEAEGKAKHYRGSSNSLVVEAVSEAEDYLRRAEEKLISSASVEELRALAGAGLDLAKTRLKELQEVVIPEDLLELEEIDPVLKKHGIEPQDALRAWQEDEKVKGRGYTIEPHKDGVVVKLDDSAQGLALRQDLEALERGGENERKAA